MARVAAEAPETIEKIPEVGQCHQLQMFTIAHELTHIWFGASAAFDLSNLHPSDKSKLARIE